MQDYLTIVQLSRDTSIKSLRHQKHKYSYFFQQKRKHSWQNIHSPITNHFGKCKAQSNSVLACFDEECLHWRNKQMPVVNALVQHQEKRGDCENVRLRSIETSVTDIKDKFLPESKNAINAFLTNFIDKLKVATEVCKKIEEKENNMEIPYLKDQREQRKKNWEDFMQRQLQHSAEVDQEYDAQIIKLFKDYSDWVDKLISDYKSRP